MHTTNIILYAIIAFRWIASLAQIQPENVTRYLNPALLYSMQLPNASIDGIAASRITGDELHLDLYLSVNQLQSSNTSSDEPMEEGWVYKIKGATKNANATPEITSRKILTFPGTTTSFVGACMYWKDANLIILNPGVKESSVSTASGETWIDGTAAHISNSGIIAIDPDTLHVRWISTVAWTSDRGVPAMAVPLPVNGTNETHLPKIVFRSHRAGLTVLDARGQTIWATTQIRPGAIVVTPSVIYALDQTPSTGYPLNVHSVETGELLGSTGPYQSGSTQTGVVMSRDARYIYAMRNGLQGGLHRYRADFVFAPSTILTTEISAAARFGPLISPGGTILYIVNPMQVFIEAYSLVGLVSLWKVTMCPIVPPLLSTDGTALYSFQCDGALAKLDAITGTIVWAFSHFPVGFIPSALQLVPISTPPAHGRFIGDDYILVSGQVPNMKNGYAYVIHSGNTTLESTQTPTSPPQPSSAPSTRDDSKTVDDRGFPPMSHGSSTCLVIWLPVFVLMNLLLPRLPA